MISHVFQNNRIGMAVAVIYAALTLSHALADQSDDRFYQPLVPADEAAEPSYGDETFTPPRAWFVLGPWARELKITPEMNVGDIHLRGTRLFGQTLTNANFAGCDLNGVRFYQCDLSKASFRGAYLTGASIEECDIADADFTDATVNGLRGDRLTEKQFKSTRSYKTKKLFHCTIQSDMVPVGDGSFVQGKPPTYDFHDASLDGAFLHGDMRQCDFTDAWLYGSRFEGVQITVKQLASTASFRRRAIANAGLSLIIEEKTLDLTGMEIADTVLACRDCTVILKDATIERSRFYFPTSKEQLYSTKNYQQGRLLNMVWSHMNMSTGWDLSHQNLTGTSFSDHDFTGANLEDAVITDVKFSLGKGLTVEQIKSTWNYKNGHMAGVVLPKELAEALQKEASEKAGVKE